ncbi:MAG TPA: response regulator [Chryseosolibacter sp.]
MRILLIDDDKDDQLLFVDAVTLISDEIICNTADDGQQGLEFLAHADPLPDLVFLDINMPRVDGRQTLQAIRSNPRLRALPVIIYSTSCSKLDIRWARDMSADYLTKPNDFLELVSALTLRLHQPTFAEVIQSASR